MKNTDQVQEEYAKSKGFSSFKELCLDEPNDIDWHVSNVQKEYATLLSGRHNVKYSIESVKRLIDGKLFSVGDSVKFSDRYPSFVLSEIFINGYERRIELHGEGLFCSMLESDC